MATVLKIPAKFHPITHLPETKVQKRRVAAYARVSTDSEEQQTSYAAQVDRYTKYIQERADWEFVAVYTDEGISALNTKHRDGFNRMVADALDGKIDLIVTKSVSRFARNTVDSLTTVRKLKEKGVEVFFEKENIYTLDSKGELLITIMSSLAQEESRSISENVTWGQRANGGWQGQPAVQAFSGLSKRSRWLAGNCAGGGRDCSEHLSLVYGGENADWHCENIDRTGHSDTCRQGTMVFQYSEKHSDQ